MASEHPNDKQEPVPLRSLYAEDEVIGEILPVFIKNLPDYLLRLDRSLAQGDLQGAARVCHDLKGTAGGYGYPDIGKTVQRLEGELKAGQQREVVEALVCSLRTLCERAASALNMTIPPIALH